MMDMSKMLIDAYMKPLFDMGLSGTLLERAKTLEMELASFASNNPGSVDLVGDSGLREVYNQLYMDAMTGNNDAVNPGAPSPKSTDSVSLPTVHEFLQQYRDIYEQSVRGKNRPHTEKAYQALLHVEERTDDLTEAQLIMERERMVLKTMTAEYQDELDNIFDAMDPNFEVTSVLTELTLGAYAKAKSTEEIRYLSEMAKLTSEDVIIRLKLKVEMLEIFYALLFGWQYAKRKIREGEKADLHAKSMVVTRIQARKFYRFLAEDMGIDFDVIENTPFYRIMMLNPKGLDGMWKRKRVMHPDNLKAMRYVLMEEILSEKTLEEILMTPQPYPFYEEIDEAYSPVSGEPSIESLMKKIRVR